MANSVDLSATGNTNWFNVTGPFLVATANTWVGTLLLQVKDPDGNAVDVADASFTANTGAKIVDVPPGTYRWSFTRSSGTATVRAWSNKDNLALSVAA